MTYVTKDFEFLYLTLQYIFFYTDYIYIMKVFYTRRQVRGSNVKNAHATVCGGGFIESITKKGEDISSESN